MAASFENTTFENLTVRSESCLLSDFMACRQLRHISKKNKKKLSKECFNGKSFAWCSDAFVKAVGIYGYACDICAAVTKIPEEKTRIAAERCLSNLDGLVKLMLCSCCSGRFRAFCTRQFNRCAPSVYSADYEKIMLAYLAWEYEIAFKAKYMQQHLGRLRRPSGAIAHSKKTHKDARVII